MTVLRPQAVLPADAPALRHRALGDLQDAQAVYVAVSPDLVWEALVAHVPRAFDHALARAFARGVGAADRVRRGEFPRAGSSIPGFSVAECVPGRSLVLEGRHRFSRYVLAFEMRPFGEGTRLVAASFADFPGLRGKAYRWLAVAPVHRKVVADLLAAVARRAEGGRDRGA